MVTTFQIQLEVFRKIAVCFLSTIDPDIDLLNNKFIEFLVTMTVKSKKASQGRYSDNIELPPMSSYSIQMA